GSDRDYLFFCSSNGLCPCGCVIGRGGFDETVRRHPDLREPAVDGRSQITFGRRGYCVLAGNVPRIITAQNPELPQLAYERLKTTSARRVFGLLPPPLVTHGGNGVIDRQDRKSTRLNSSHVAISYAVFCLKKKKKD